MLSIITQSVGHFTARSSDRIPLENRGGTAGGGLGLRSEVVFPRLEAPLGDAGAAVLNRGSSLLRLRSDLTLSISFDLPPFRILPAFCGGVRVS